MFEVLPLMHCVKLSLNSSLWRHTVKSCMNMNDEKAKTAIMFNIFEVDLFFSDNFYFCLTVCHFSPNIISVSQPCISFLISSKNIPWLISLSASPAPPDWWRGQLPPDRTEQTESMSVSKPQRSLLMMD